MRPWVALRWRSITAAALIGVGVGLLAWAAVALTRGEWRIASVWMANAAIVAALVARRRSDEPWILGFSLVGNVVANLVNGDQLGPALLLSTFNLVEAAIAARIMRWRCPRAARLADRRSIGRLVTASFVAPLLSGAAAAAFLSGQDDALLRTFLHWYVADSLGLLIVTPLLLAFTRHLDRHTPRRLLEPLFWGCAATIVAVGVFKLEGPFLFLVAPLITMAAFRGGFVAATVAIFATAAVATVMTAAGQGPIATTGLDPAGRNYLVQIFIASLVVLGLPVRALAGESSRLGRALALSEVRFRRLAEASPSGIMHLDPVGRATYLNQRWTTMLGLDIRGASDGGWLDAVDAGHRDQVESSYERCRTRRVAEVQRVAYQRSDGSDGWADFSFFPQADERRRDDGVVVRLSDVTAEATAMGDLVAARDLARAAAEAKSNFLATMSHEIRTPLTGVLGMIDLLHEEPSPEERRHYLATLKQSATLLMTVLDDVLDFSKIESGALRLDDQPFDFDRLLHATINLFRTAASRKGLLLRLDVRPDGPPVRGDPIRIQQVLSNLINNAIKFTPDGEVEVRARHCAEGDRRRWTIEVVDTGIGIAPDEADQLFEPFVQAEPTDSRRYGGTGLGLAISRRLVEAMDGHLGVDSVPGQGSRFWIDIVLPVAAAGEAVDLITRPADGGTTTRALDLLVAEDNPVNQLLIDAILRRLGHQVHLVANGRQAVKAASEHLYDAVLMDMQMPELDGLAATRQIRALSGSHGRVPIIALTADASAERRRFYQGAGLTAFLTKPIDQARLAAELSAVAMFDAAPQENGPSVVTGRGGAAPVLDATRLEELHGALGAQRVGELLQLLASECRTRPDRIRTLLRSGKLAEARREAHSFKGAAASAGAIPLADVAAHIEGADRLDQAIGLLDPLATLARDTARAAAQWAREPDAAPPCLADPPPRRRTAR